MPDPKLFIFVVIFGVMFAFGSLFYKMQGSKANDLTAFREMSPNSDEYLCSNIENGLYDTLVSNQYCIKDSDCAVFKFENTCGFGCHKILNRNTNLSEITDLMSEYISKCGQCTTSCPEPPKSSLLECVNFQCVES